MEGINGFFTRQFHKIIKGHFGMSLQAWQSTLSSQGAHFNQQMVLDFGDAEQELAHTKSSNVMCDLSHLGLLDVSGPDAMTFLQGQLTNDIKQLNSNQAHITGYCSPKGRLLALLLAFAQQEHYYLQLPQVLLEPIAKRLKMFVMRSKVVITDTADSIIKIGLNGPQARQLLNKHFTAIPQQPFEMVSHAQTTIIQLPTPDGQQRYQLYTNNEFASTLWQALKNDFKLVGKPCWDYLETLSGLPEVTAETQEQFVPQMVNLDLLNGINFKKGCYTGQEIVARTHYLGTVKRRTFLASIFTTTMPQAGDKLHNEQKEEIGQIVRASPITPEEVLVLAELRIEAKENNTVIWQNVPLSFMALPYSLGATGA
jgi:tRNA-modifying protein YgfZ